MLKVQFKPFRGQIGFQENFNNARSMFYGLLKGSRFSDLHDSDGNKKLFSYTPIMGGRLTSNGNLSFDNGGCWLFTCVDDGMMSFVTAKLDKLGQLGGMDIHKIMRFDDRMDEYIVDGRNKFVCQPGFIACMNRDGKRTFFTYQEHGNELFEFLTRQTKKAIEAKRPDIDLSDFKILPAQQYYKKKTMHIGSVLNFYNEKGIIYVNGNREAVKMLHKMGLGNSTGCGFGLLQPVKL